MRTLVGVACGPRPRLITGAPSMSSVHAGLSGSFTLAEVFFGNLTVVARCMFLALTKPWADGEECGLSWLLLFL